MLALEGATNENSDVVFELRQPASLGGVRVMCSKHHICNGKVVLFPIVDGRIVVW